MKGVLLLTAITLIVNFQISFSQVVIHKADFQLESSYETSSLLEYKANLQPPSNGDNQTWDLTNLNATHVIDEEYKDASSDEFFTNATNYKETVYLLNDFIIESKDFFVADEQGYSKIGRRLTEVEFPIVQITGGANDKLKVNGGNVPFDNRLDYIKFPLEYENTWTGGYNRVTNFELTVEGFGLNETPGVLISYITETRTVVGSGKLTLPNKDGGVMTIDALLIEVNNTEVDSVFLGGKPAPPQLMTAFNLTQGQTDSENYYVYYSPGYTQSVASYDITGGFISYSVLASVSTSVESDMLNLSNIYPNPVKSGSMLNISNTKFNISNIVLVDQSGKIVLENEISGNSNLSIPNTVTSGAYLLNSYDSNGTIISTNKIIIE